MNEWEGSILNAIIYGKIARAKVWILANLGDSDVVSLLRIFHV